MTIKRRSGATWVNPAAIKRRSGAAWVGVSTIKRRLSGAWVTVWSSMSVTGANIVKTAAVTGTQTTAAANMTVTGGSGTYSTYAWTRVSGDTTMTCSSTAIKNPTFSANATVAVPDRITVWRLTVTDNVGTVASCDITVTISYTGP